MKNYEVELVSVSLKEDIFFFEIYRKDSDTILASYVVQHGKVVKDYDSYDHEEDVWDEETKEKAFQIAVGKKYFEIAEQAYEEDLAALN